MLAAMSAYWITPEIESDIKLVGQLTQNPVQWANYHYFLDAASFKLYSLLRPAIKKFSIVDETIYIAVKDDPFPSRIILEYVDLIEIAKLNILLQSLYIRHTRITNFDPVILNTDLIVTIDLNDNFLTTFSPKNGTYTNVNSLNLANNKFTPQGYAEMENYANTLSLGAGTFRFTGNPQSVAGTTLEAILIAKGRTVIA